MRIKWPVPHFIYCILIPGNVRGKAKKQQKRTTMICKPKASGQGLITSYGYLFSRPQPGCHLPNSPWSGIIKLFPARESLVSDIPAGDGKNCNIFYSVRLTYLYIGVHHIYPETKFVHTVHMNTYFVETCTCYMTVANVHKSKFKSDHVSLHACKVTIPIFF